MSFLAIISLYHVAKYSYMANIFIGQTMVQMWGEAWQGAGFERCSNAVGTRGGEILDAGPFVLGTSVGQQKEQ
jgi:hypothetical protein